ncbi:MAG: hypothetical protein H0X37_20195 [Herpetosiphonaceae bacterium]|nr:hypothetical protein [Herpetosiphonaceae bacterium]
MSSSKTEIIKSLFFERWDDAENTLSSSLVTLADVTKAIRDYNEQHPQQKRLVSDANPANFFKDFVRKRSSSNTNWPQSMLDKGYTGRQVTGGNQCFEFIPIRPGQTQPFPENQVLPPGPHTPRQRIESISMPLASRRLGRRDEPWLIQVIVRQRVIETHFSLFSSRKFVQIDHVQMSVKLAHSEIDALFLGIEDVGSKAMQEVIICCEAKGLRDDVLENQILRQAQAVFKLKGVSQNIVIPMAIKAIGRSRVHVIEFDAVERQHSETTTSLNIASDAVYEFVPPIEGVGG